MKISPLASLQKKVFPDKACKKHWKQELTVQTLLHTIKQNRNFQDVSVQKSKLVLSKSKNCQRQCYQCFKLKPPKHMAGCHFEKNL